MKRDLLRELRELEGKRPSVSEKLGISTIHLRKLENGDVNPSVNLMYKISNFFKRKPEELFPDIIPPLK